LADNECQNDCVINVGDCHRVQSSRIRRSLCLFLSTFVCTQDNSQSCGWIGMKF